MIKILIILLLKYSIFVSITPVKPLVSKGIKRNSDGFFFYIRGMKPEPAKKIPYHNPPINVIQQIELLKEKGLIIADNEVAGHWLSHISYFRFKQYSYSFKDYQQAEGNYIPDTTFEMVRDLYVFDRRLKMLLFEALENIEISVKTQLSNVMSIAHGAHWYTDPAHFLSEEDRRQIIRNARNEDDIPKVFDHGEFLRDIEDELEYPSETFLQHYKKNFEPIYPPSWMMMEIITFGTLSLMFENLKPSVEKNTVCDSFLLPKKHLVSWLHSFSFIRNKCAHHARLVYAKINFAPALPQKKSRQFLTEADHVDNNSLYAVLCCIQYMLKICNNSSKFKINLVQLIDEFPGINYGRLGFTPQWRNEDFWT